MANLSIKSLIVNALTNNTSLDNIKKEFLRIHFINTHKPRYSSNVPRTWMPMNEFLAGLRRLGMTDAELEAWEKEWDEMIISVQKRAKKKSLTEVSIEAIVKARLKGTGIKYIMRKQQYRVALTLCIGRNSQATFYIQHSKFREQLELILPTVEQINSLMEELGQPIRIKAEEKRVKWELSE